MIVSLILIRLFFAKNAFLQTIEKCRMKRINSRSKVNDKKSFVIVAIGASAGGIEAVTELLKNLPSNTGITFAC